MKIYKAIAIGMLAITLTACTKTATPIDKLSKADQQYYESLSKFKIDNQEGFETYIRNYVEYKDKDIPEETFKQLEQLTDSSIVETQLKPNFSNYQQEIVDPNLQEIEGDTGTIDQGQETDESIQENEDTGALNRVLEILYLYKEHTFAAKISPVYGQTYMLYFEVQDGKVVNIYA